MVKINLPIPVMTNQHGQKTAVQKFLTKHFLVSKRQKNLLIQQVFLWLTVAYFTSWTVPLAVTVMVLSPAWKFWSATLALVASSIITLPYARGAR